MNRLADAELIQELGRFARGEAFDEQPMPGLDSEAIDFRTASESFAAVRKLARRDLETLRLVTRHQGRKVPTVGGTDKSRIVDRAEIHALRENATVRQIGVLPASLRDGD